jgi:hypothetical protein
MEEESVQRIKTHQRPKYSELSKLSSVWLYSARAASAVGAETIEAGLLSGPPYLAYGGIIESTSLLTGRWTSRNL